MGDRKASYAKNVPGGTINKEKVPNVPKGTTVKKEIPNVPESTTKKEEVPNISEETTDKEEIPNIRESATDKEEVPNIPEDTTKTEEVSNIPEGTDKEKVPKVQHDEMYEKNDVSNKESSDTSKFQAPNAEPSTSNPKEGKEGEKKMEDEEEEDNDDAYEDVVMGEGPNEEEEEERNPHEHGEDHTDSLQDVLEFVGEFGRYQKFLFICMAPFAASFALVYLVQMFVVAVPTKFWCKVPELDHITDLDLKRRIVSPQKSNGQFDPCLMYNVNYKELAESALEVPDTSSPLIPCKQGYEYDFSEIPYTTVSTEREWVCKRSGFRPIAQTLFFIGSIVGGVLFGWMADRYGRVPALVGSNISGLIGAVGSTFTTGLWDFVLCRFIAGMSFDNCFMMMYILVLEYVGPRHRTMLANMSVAIYFGGACVALPWLAYYIADWKTLIYVTSIPNLAAFAAPWLVPESARWLANSGRIRKAVSILRKFERINKTRIPKSAMDRFVAASRQVHKHETMVTIFRSRPLRMMMIFMLVVYMTGAIVYDALVRMSQSLGMDFFLTFTLVAATEIPSNAAIALFLDKFGRRNFTVGPMCMSGLLCFIALFVPRGVPLVSLAITARFTVILGYNAATQWATELLPTGVRASGSSLVHVSGYVAKFLAPNIVYAEKVWIHFPLVVLTISAVLGGAIAVLLPETNKKQMPQTIADGEELMVEGSLCWKRSRMKNSKKLSSVLYGPEAPPSPSPKRRSGQKRAPGQKQPSGQKIPSGQKQPSRQKPPTGQKREPTKKQEPTQKPSEGQTPPK